MEKVTATSSALDLIEVLKDEFGDLLFHQSGGCCDGSAPMCFPKDEFFINETDILIGHLAGVPFYMSKDQYAYWKHTFLTIDVTEGRGSSFSLELPKGVRFITKSSLAKN